MPHNGSGSFSLSDTIANGTANDATELQAILDDIATGLTNAVCVDGQSTMTGVLKLANGSAAAPSVTFGSDTDTGIYRYGANQVGVAVGGVASGYFASTGWNGAVVGNVTGNVTGNLTGNVTGNVTGDVTGTASGNPPNARTITAGTGLSGGGDLSANRTLSLATSGVSAATYVSPSSVTVDVYGRITAITSGGVKTVCAGYFTYNGSTVTLGTGSFNVTSISRDSAGVFTVTIDTDAANTNYWVIVNADSLSFANVPLACCGTDRAVGTFKIRTYIQGSGVSDPARCDFEVRTAA